MSNKCLLIDLKIGKGGECISHTARMSLQPQITSSEICIRNLLRTAAILFVIEYCLGTGLCPSNYRKQTLQ